MKEESKSIDENLEHDLDSVEDVDKNLETDSDEVKTDEGSVDVNEFEVKYNETLDKYQRLMAEFENFRKRNDKEKIEMFDQGSINTILKLLPVLDNFERGIEAIPKDVIDENINQGFVKIYNQMKAIFDEIGVTYIEALGKEFDPNLHNAIMHDEDKDKDTNVITEEFQKGYKYKDKVIRYSMVKVVN